MNDASRTLGLLAALTLFAAPGMAAQHGDPAEHGDHAAHGAAHAHRSFDDPAHYAQSWDDPARDAWQKPRELVAALDVRPGMSVADIGTGTGYLLPHLSRAAGATGRVHAVDVEPKMLEWVATRAKREGLQNVATVLAQGGATGLPAASVDRAIMINVWHHIEDPAAYARDMARVLRPGGVLFIVEARHDMQEEGGPPAHFRLPPQKIIAQLEQAGLKAGVDAFGLDRQYVVRATR